MDRRCKRAGGTKDKLWGLRRGCGPERQDRDEAVELDGNQAMHSLQFHVKIFFIFCKKKDRMLKTPIRRGNINRFTF